MARSYYRAIQRGDLEYLATRLRAADIDELHATHGADCDFLDILKKSVSVTPNAEIRVDEDGDPIAIRGCAPHPTLGGIPWLLATDKAYALPAAFLIEGRQFYKAMTEEFGRLVNYVDARNTKSIRWLARIGFTIHEPEPFGVQGLAFHRFTGTRNGLAEG